MNIKKEYNGTNIIIEIELDDNIVVDSLALGMITNNSINGIAPATCTQLDNVRHLRYVVNSKISMSQLIQNAVNKKLLLGVVSNILKVLISSEDYMLNSKTILLDNEYIFIDPANGSVSMICVPLMQEHNERTLYDFFKALIFSVQVDFSENSEYIVRLINYFNSKTSIDRIDFASFVVNLMNTANSDHIPSYNLSNKQTVQTVPSTHTAESSQPIQSVQFIPPVHTTISPVQQNVSSTQKTVFQDHAQQTTVYQPSVRDVNRSAVESHNNAHTNNVSFKIPSVDNSHQVNVADKQGINNESVDKKTRKKGFRLFGGKKTEVNDTKETKTAKSGSGFKFAVPGQVITVNDKDSTKANSSGKSVQVMVSDTIQSNHNYFPHTQQVEGNFGQTTVLGIHNNETTVLGVSGETTVLGTIEQKAPPVICPCLIRLKSNEKIIVDKPVFRIGKEKSYVDYFIGDNSTISRSHANIITREGKYFVVDTNSTNHTFLDGSILQSNSEYEISHGSKLRFANEDFEFKLY